MSNVIRRRSKRARKPSTKTSSATRSAQSPLPIQDSVVPLGGMSDSTLSNTSVSELHRELQTLRAQVAHLQASPLASSHLVNSSNLALPPPLSHVTPVVYSTLRAPAAPFSSPPIMSLSSTSTVSNSSNQPLINPQPQPVSMGPSISSDYYMGGTQLIAILIYCFQL